MEIYGTLGPACANAEVLKAMFEEGMTGMRLNLSHGSLEDSRSMIEAFHKGAQAAGVSADLLIDMQGPELRIGTLPGEVELTEGEYVILRENESIPCGRVALEVPEQRQPVVEMLSGQERVIPIPEDLAQHIDKGDKILLDDGILELAADETREGSVRALVLRGGIIRSRKSIKIADKPVYGAALTQQDRMNLERAKDFGVTSVMQPFVRGKEDLLELRRELKKHGLEDLRIFAKIENREGIRKTAEIAEEADMVVIARGDLGNDMPLWELPVAQKEIEAICRRMNKPFLVVTQMLTSMVHAKVPTRAEVSDIFNAVCDGADAVMVTNETAVGEYPVEVIRYLYKTAAEGERWRQKHM